MHFEPVAEHVSATDSEAEKSKSNCLINCCLQISKESCAEGGAELRGTQHWDLDVNFWS